MVTLITAACIQHLCDHTGNHTLVRAELFSNENHATEQVHPKIPCDVVNCKF